MLSGGRVRAAVEAAGCSSQPSRGSRGCGRTFSPQAGPQLFFTCSPHRKRAQQLFDTCTSGP